METISDHVEEDEVMPCSAKVLGAALVYEDGQMRMALKKALGPPRVSVTVAGRYDEVTS